jgi:ABC-2 type transport system ATP-binding protein
MNSLPSSTPPAAIEVAGLSKSYGRHTVVEDVSFQVRAGSITGFLGPNGAGKSTTLRMLVGLTRPTAGHSRVLGVPFTQLPNPGRRAGVLLDAAAQHAGRTGREVLTITALTTGVPTSRVGEMIELVGLTAAEARRRTGTYSLGMRQRLGIAQALIGDPQVVILDEPANGLDPAGIHWMRGLLRDFADRGGAVLLSSHLLREVEVVADELVVIGRGRIVARGSKTGLLAASGTHVRATDNQALATALDAAAIRFRTDGDGYLADAAAEQVASVAGRAGVIVLELRPAGGGLEELFLQLTADDTREQVPA